jgi:hypothetical protein
MDEVIRILNEIGIKRFIKKKHNENYMDIWFKFNNCDKIFDLLLDGGYKININNFGEIIKLKIYVW